MPTLRWLTRDEDVRAAEKVPYRLLEEVPELGAGDRGAGNMLIQGDNLEALKALLPYYAGAVKCIYIDPPYNTGSAFEHYDDNLEHSQWLAMMWPRLELLRDLLAEDGSIWVSIDDREGHYLKVIMDEVFGRKNFIGNIIWEKSDSPRMDAVFVSSRHDNTLCFSKSRDQTLWKRLELREEDIPNHYNRTDEVGRRYYTKPLRAMGGQGDSRETRPTLYYALTAPDGTKVFPKRQDGSDGAWRWSPEKVTAEIDRIEWVQGKAGWTPYFRIFAENIGERPIESIWFHTDVGSNRTSKAEAKAVLRGDIAFTTPKPERLLERILHIATNPGDLVLDSFLGSGTTAAVAQKMGRRYIGIEMGDHAVTHCAPRLQKVIDGEQGGISKAQSWHGGGGFRFYRLGPPVFAEDGQIQPDIRFAVLAAHIWFAETGQPWTEPQPLTPFLGAQGGKGYALLYNGILGDKSVSGGNVLTRKTLSVIRAAQAGFTGPLTIYGERTALSEATLKAEQIEFKQTPYDVKARK